MYELSGTTLNILFEKMTLQFPKLGSHKKEKRRKSY